MTKIKICKIIGIGLTTIILLTGLSCSLGSKSGSDGGVYRSTDGGNSWEHKGYVEQIKKKTVTINSVNVRKMKFDPYNRQIIYLATNSDGLYKTTDGGESWKKTGLQNMQITDLGIDAKNPNIIYVTSGQYLYKTSDAGENWTKIYTENKSSGILYNVAVDSFDGNKIYLTNNLGGMFKSYDAGNSWQQIYWFDNPVSSLEINPRDTRLIYAIIENKGIWYSQNGGDDWSELNAGLKQFGKSGKKINSFVIDSDNSLIYMGTDYGLLKSDDGGETWAAIKTLIGFDTQPIKKVVINPQNKNLIYHTTSKLIYCSKDGGFNWTSLEPINSKRGISDILINPDDSNIIYVGMLTIKK